MLQNPPFLYVMPFSSLSLSFFTKTVKAILSILTQSLKVLKNREFCQKW